MLYFSCGKLVCCTEGCQGAQIFTRLLVSKTPLSRTVAQLLLFNKFGWISSGPPSSLDHSQKSRCMNGPRLRQFFPSS